MARFYGVRVVDMGCFECMYPFLSNTTRLLDGSAHILGTDPGRDSCYYLLIP
jgi:hypothetical protein